MKESRLSRVETKINVFFKRFGKDRKEEENQGAEEVKGKKEGKK